ncbi:MAG: hypothetical protein ABJN36_02275 [Cyclobacteriaceae bacterium]
MKFLARLILISIFTYGLSLYAPWWILFVVTFGVCFGIHGSSINTFIGGFLGVGLVWLVTAWILDYQSNAAFTDKMVQLFPVEDGILLVILSGIIGGVCGGLGALTGNSFKQLFVKQRKKSIYS